MNLSYAIWLTVSGALALLVAWLGWRRRAAPGALALMTLMLALGVWSLSYALHWLAPNPSLRGFWLQMTYFGVVVSPVAFFVMVHQFIGRDGWLTRRAYAFLSFIPLLTLIFLWTDSFHGLFFGRRQVELQSTILSGGAWFFVFVFYSYGLLAIGFVLLFRAYLRSAAFYRRQVRVLLAGALLPWLVNFLMLAGWNPLPGLDLTPLAFAASGLFFAYGFFGYRMMDLVPVGRDVLVENLDDAIVVVDTQGRIVDINPKAMELADPGMEMPYGKPFREVYSRWANLISSYSGLDGRAEVKLDNSPVTHVDLRVIPLKDRQGSLLGKLATWRDISARKQAEERLRVFFRAVEQNPVAILITDADGWIEYANPHFVRLTGYSLEEVRGKNPRLLKSGETSMGTYEDLWKTIKAGQVWEGEVLNRKKNGELYWAYELIAPVLAENGLATHFVAMQQDITARKNAESELRVANARLQAQLIEIESLHDQLREEAIRDGLTRLFNRRYMEETLEREIFRLDRDPKPISVVMMDVDLFKSINDTYGHQAGDAVLQTLGTMLLENTRTSDIACRYGGDEMLVVMPGANMDTAVARAEEWRAAFSQMFFNFGKKRINTTLSLGIASFPDQARSAIELLVAADQALYWAKIRRNHVALYDPSIMTRGTNRSDAIR